MLTESSDVWCLSRRLPFPFGYFTLTKKQKQNGDVELYELPLNVYLAGLDCPPTGYF